jgi:hypothetical protein
MYVFPFSDLYSTIIQYGDAALSGTRAHLEGAKCIRPAKQLVQFFAWRDQRSFRLVLGYIYGRGEDERGNANGIGLKPYRSSLM